MVILICVCLAVLVFAIAGFYNKLTAKIYTVKNAKLPPEFDGYKIVHLSDIHCHRIGKGNEKLIEAVNEQKPDMIAITGDTITRRTKDISMIEELLRGICGKVPILAIPGNHEFDSPQEMQALLKLYKKYGVTFLNGGHTKIAKNGAEIYIYGAEIVKKRPRFYFSAEGMKPLYPQKFGILLNHFSNQFGRVAGAGYDLVLSGHLHGGIIRLPIIGGLFGNKMSLFPKYSSGMFEENGSTLISNCGVGDVHLGFGKLFAPRFYNRREICVITLKKQ